MIESKSLNVVRGLVSEISSLFQVARKSKKQKNGFGSLEMLGVENLEAREVPAANGFTGQVAIINAPKTVEVNKLEDNNYAKLFAEQTNTTLSSQLTVDASKVGSYSHESSFRPANILEGTKVNSYYLHADRVGSPATFQHARGSITFNEPILGVVTTQGNLNLSDVLGSKNTVYSKAGRNIDGTDMINPDWFSISEDRKTITFDFQTSTASDDVRIITAATPLSNVEVEKVFLKAPEATTHHRTLAINAPKTVEVNKLENANYAMFFAEKTGVTLGTNLKVDASSAGVYDLKSSLTPATILAGTRVNSYYLHADRVGTPTVFDKVSGSVTFETPILGVIATKDNMNVSDSLGADGTVYSKSGRYLDIGAPNNLDKFWISADMKTLRYELQTSTACDDLRIITGVATIPSVPLNLTATANKGGVVKLDWKAPAFDGFSAIKNYLIEYSSDGGKTWVQSSKPNSSTLQAAINGLTRGATYSFRISASNDKGSSLSSTAVSVKVI